MCSKFRYLETLEFSNYVSNGFSCQYSEDDRVLITTDCGIQILQLCMRPDVVAPNLCFKKFYIPVDKYLFSTNVGIDANNFANDLTRLEFYDLALSVDVSPKLFLYHEINSKVSMAKWSPAFLDGSNCILAILTDMGSLQVYARTFLYSIYEDYTSICNLSSHIINVSKMKWGATKNLSPSDLLKELKERAQMKPTAFNWSQLMKSETGNYALLVVGHLNEIITVWRVSVSNYINKEANVRCMLKIKSNLSHITSLHMANTNDRGLLHAGDYNGNATAIPLMYITDNEIKIGDHLHLLTKNDEIQVKHIEILYHNGYMFIIFVKSSSLFISLLGKNGDLLDNCIFDVGNMDIVSLEILIDNVIIIQTITGLMNELKLACIRNKIYISWRHIYINVNWSIKRSHGTILSTNKVLFGILTHPCKLSVKKFDKNPVNLILFQNMSRDPLQLILDNQENMLHNYWDCFEVLRVSSLIDKQLPCINFPKMNGHLDISSMKTYLHISAIYCTIYGVQDTCTSDSNVESYETLKYIFDLTLILYRMRYLLKLQQENNVTEFQMQNLFLLANHVKEQVLNESKIDVLEKFGMFKGIKEVLIASCELEYPKMPKCLVCKERIIDSSCTPRHFEQRCAITLMPLDYSSSYKCPFCKCRAHTKLREETKMLLCPYCDIEMDSCTIEGTVKEERSID